MQETSQGSDAVVSLSSKPLKRLLSPKEFYEEFNGALGLQSIYEMLRSERIRSVKVGSHYKIPHSELENFALREAGLLS